MAPVLALKLGKSLVSASAVALAWTTWFDRCRLVVCAFLQSIRTTRKSKGRFGISENATLFAEMYRELGDHLLDFVSQEVEKDASIMKRVREATEERNLAQANKKETT